MYEGKAIFNPGDVVQLKSGGPSMTIVLQDKESGNVACVWHSFDEDVKERNFQPEVLQRAEAEAEEEDKPKKRKKTVKKGY